MAEVTSIRPGFRGVPADVGEGKGRIPVACADLQGVMACWGEGTRHSAIATMLVILTLAVLTALCSCAMFRDGPNGFSLLDGDPEEADREEYDALEYLEDHPLDPMKADPDELRSLPGFPDHLVERLIAERRRNATARRLFEALTPPEREVLRRYESYIELPGRLPLEFEAWLTSDRLEHEAERRDDARMVCSGERFRLSARYRSEEIYRFYLAGSLPTGHLRLHGGDFTPDLAMGLCFSSYTASYPFSHGYHLRERRWVSCATSLSSASMRGCAAEIWAGPVRLLLLGGRRCSYSDGRLDVEGPSIRCGRFGMKLGRFSAGTALHTVEGLTPGPVCSVDASWFGERFGAAAEIAAIGHEWSSIWALSVRGEISRMGLLIYDIQHDWDGSMGRSFYGAGKRRRGCSIVLDRRITRRIRILSAFERSGADDSYEAKVRDLLRFECRWSAGGKSIKLSFKRRIERRSILIPSPLGGEQPENEVTDSIQLLQKWRLPASLRLRISCRVPLERGRSGYLVCPSLTIDRRFHATLTWAVHRALEGTPTFYCYERSLKGQYPWRALRGDGWRVALLGGVSIGPLRLALGLATQKSGPYEAAAQAAVKF
jgi:hypothetical protein